MRLKRTALALLVAGCLIAALAGDAAKGSAAGATPAWAEVAWPFAMDQWGLGRAFRCKAADCGRDLTLYLRAKIGFCNCTTGITEDDEIDRVGDVDLVGRQTRAQRFGVPVEIGWMKGRSRSFMVASPNQAQRFVLAVVVSNKCDAIVATLVADHVLPPDIEREALDFLASEPVLRWAEATTGL